ncbi:predicted protein [Sclerotinia sclerotiorum 1980 UF-70]|uniref:Uncharacterized protein n=1 Tax=Sclerotinia sclerotiorum (strain ATCC 18683 / 1980 / Ss-1) TaxID=665079 RepID=A7EWI9_SCLS1|nr:predicted protein [Sclerotinia sclerotiorum 1980 UF-70]EDN93831.1 predicted protein [Sclerotinia sclerotiorum 1980 UF-70]
MAHKRDFSSSIEVYRVIFVLLIRENNDLVWAHVDVLDQCNIRNPIAAMFSSVSTKFHTSVHVREMVLAAGSW